MNPNDPFNNQPPPVIIPPQGNTQQGQAMGYSFSSEELRVLRECNSESFWQRSLPFGIISGVGTWLAVQRGILSASPRFGATPKVAFSCLFGYFLGKFSYQKKCAEKIMQLGPSSRLAEALRRKRKGEFFESINPDGGLSLAPFSSSTDVYSDETMRQPAKPNNSMDIDVDRPLNSGLDDTYRPSLDTPDRNFNDNLPLDAPKSTTTYEELRRRNREEYEKKLSNPYYRPVPDDGPNVRRPLQRREEAAPPAGPTNQYGDVWIK